MGGATRNRTFTRVLASTLDGGCLKLGADVAVIVTTANHIVLWCCMNAKSKSLILITYLVFNAQPCRFSTEESSL